MKKQDCYYLGKIVSKYSFKGEILLKLASRDLLNVKPSSIFIDINNILVPFSIVKISLHKSMLLRMLLDEVNSEAQADKILNKHTYLYKNDLPILDKKEFYFEEIIGFQIIDSKLGKVGTIDSINSQTTQTLAFVDNNKGNIVMVPLVEAFIDEIDKKDNVIYVTLPEGLLDLNL